MAEYACEVVERPDEAPLMVLARRERVVRCWDCAHWDGSSGCTLLDFAMDKDISDGFCAWAEPREEA